jgi:hypothetical protein
MKGRFKMALLVMAIVAVSASFACCQDPVFSINITAPLEPTVTACKLKVSLKNISDQEISASSASGRGEFNYVVEIHDSSGKTPELTKYHRAVRGMNTNEQDRIKKFRLEMSTSTDRKRVYLAPGANLDDELDLAKLYTLSPGNYSVRVEREDKGSKMTVKSNTITFVVAP